MSKCEECIHFVACVDFWFSDYDCFDNIEQSKQKHANNKACEHFKSSADVAEVRHGEWVSYISPVCLGGNLYYKCSVCGESDPWQHTTRGRATYCPNCGAKMDGERKEK